MMEAWFPAAAWPVPLTLQVVVDGEPRDPPVDVVIGRYLNKGRTKGRNSWAYCLSNAVLTRRVREINACTVGFRLVDATFVRWELATTVGPPPARRRCGMPGP